MGSTNVLTLVIYTTTTTDTDLPLEEVRSLVPLESHDSQMSDPKVHLVALLVLQE